MSTNIDLLQLAFAYAATLHVIGSDAVEDPSEVAWLHERFPPELLRNSGFVDGSGRFTAAYLSALEQARRELPSRLTEGQKLAMMEALVQAAASDGVLAAEEADQLAQFALQLGLPDHAWQSHLGDLIASGRIRRDDAGI